MYNGFKYSPMERENWLSSLYQNKGNLKQIVNDGNVS